MSTYKSVFESKEIKEHYKSLFIEGVSSIDIPKEKIKSKYNSLTLASSDDTSFKKPAFNSIDATVEQFDNGNVIVTTGGLSNPRERGKEGSHWYELE